MTMAGKFVPCCGPPRAIQMFNASRSCPHEGAMVIASGILRVSDPDADEKDVLERSHAAEESACKGCWVG